MAGSISAVAGGAVGGQKNRNRGHETETETGPRRGMRGDAGCDKAGRWGLGVAC